MADGKNENRTLRVLEILNDYHTLQMHIKSHIERPTATAPDKQAYNEIGYVLMRRCAAEHRALLARTQDSGSRDGQTGSSAAAEVEKANLQRIMLDAATRRFEAHRVYLRVAAATRWTQLRLQMLDGKEPADQKAVRRRAMDRQLEQEVNATTDRYVFTDLGSADLRKNYWTDEDPSLERILAWLQHR